MKIANILKDTCIICTPGTMEREQVVALLHRNNIHPYGLPYNAPLEYNIIKVYPRFTVPTTYNIIASYPIKCEEVQASEFIKANGCGEFIVNPGIELLSVELDGNMVEITAPPVKYPKFENPTTPDEGKLF